MNLRDMGRAFWYVQKMEIEPAISKFAKWCYEVALVSTKEWRECRVNYPYYNNVLLANRIVLKNMGKMLPVNIMDRFIKVNPNLQTLIDKLELEVDFEHIVKELNQE